MGLYSSILISQGFQSIHFLFSAMTSSRLFNLVNSSTAWITPGHTFRCCTQEFSLNDRWHAHLFKHLKVQTPFSDLPSRSHLRSSLLLFSIVSTITICPPSRTHTHERHLCAPCPTILHAERQADKHVTWVTRPIVVMFSGYIQLPHLHFQSTHDTLENLKAYSYGPQEPSIWQNSSNSRC